MFFSLMIIFVFIDTCVCGIGGKTRDQATTSLKFSFESILNGDQERMFTERDKISVRWVLQKITDQVPYLEFREDSFNHTDIIFTPDEDYLDLFQASQDTLQEKETVPFLLESLDMCHRNANILESYISSLKRIVNETEQVRASDDLGGQESQTDQPSIIDSQDREEKNDGKILQGNSCKREADCITALVVVGGSYRDYLSSAELLVPDGDVLQCGLSNLPKISSHQSLTQARSGHTLTSVDDKNLLLCGGYTRIFHFHPRLVTENTCLTFNATASKGGAWGLADYRLDQERHNHGAIKINDDGGERVLIIGGTGRRSDMTTEYASHGKTNPSELRLTEPFENGCLIDLENTNEFILTGGGNPPRTDAIQYSSQGMIKRLPHLNIGRRQHGCGIYFNREVGEDFYIVAGGWTDTSRSQGFAGTEILQAGGIAWNKFAPQLPKPLHSIASVSLGSSVALIGGHDGGKDILIFSGRRWKTIGLLKESRQYPGVAKLRLSPEELEQLCL